MPGSDAAWLAAEIKAERNRRRLRPFKGSPERQCTARRRDGTQCKAHRVKKEDGTLYSTCRVHGSAYKTLEVQINCLVHFERLTRARLAGIVAKRAILEEQRERERNMASITMSVTDITNSETNK